MATGEIRQVVGAAGRTVHVRRLGQGRPVVLLHESPRSSAVLLPLASRLAAAFTVFAIDTPGYGYSDPLPLRRPEITDFADAVAAAMRALGLGRVPVYGTHTGATIAAEMGRRHPDLVGGLVLDGYPVFTVAERDLHHGLYLPSFAPRWDGGHVAALWTRVRDQFDFFPWYAPGEAARLTTPKASLQRHRAVLRDFLAAGETYSLAYAASFRFEALSVLHDLPMPTHVMARETDLLFSHLERLGKVPAPCVAGVLPTDIDAWAAAISMRFANMAGDAAPPAPRDVLDPSSTGRKGVFDGRLLCRCYGPSDAQRRPPVVLLHDTPGSALECNDIAIRLATDRRVFVPELPNHGLSPDLDMTTDGLASLLRLLGGLLATLGPRVALVGYGTNAVLATALGAAQGSGVERVVTVANLAPDVGLLAEPLDAPLPERWDGADLMEAWFAARDRTLYGSSGTAAAGATALPEIGFDVAAIHERFRSRIMAAGQDRLYQAALEAGVGRSPPAAPVVHVALAERVGDGATGSPFIPVPRQLGGRTRAALDK